MFSAISRSAQRGFKISSKSFATYKTSTGLVGLAVDPNGKENLLKLTAQVLESVKKIPETAEYRTSVEKWMIFLSKTASSTDDIRVIEDEVNVGQIEEIIVMVKDELKLVDYYYENKVWEMVEEEGRTADEVMKSMANVINFTNAKTVE